MRQSVSDEPEAALRADLFRGRAVLVVGGTGGIGGSVAEHFGRLGARVVVAGLPSKSPLPPSSAVAEVVDLDLSRPDDLEALIASQDRLDVLVNCAGMIRRRLEYQPEVFAQVIEVNLTGTMRACVAAHPLLAATRGCIINVASMLSYFGGPLVPAYSASKGGVVQLTKALAVRFADDGVRVNAVAPGWIRTDLTAALQVDDHRSADIVSRTPLGRWGQTDDVTGAAVFLAGPDAAFVTGVILPVDGGYLAT